MEVWQAVQKRLVDLGGIGRIREILVCIPSRKTLWWGSDVAHRKDEWLKSGPVLWLKWVLLLGLISQALKIGQPGSATSFEAL
jgi:hypothetical protein